VAVTAAEWPLVIASVADGRRKMHLTLWYGISLKDVF
jgi:hypothetical protein